ncbi:class I SAM-dependent methyltransferase [Lutimonas zeaxanthinifaciens]|uniref:class I SAM-dependent methyltransferase n=1 Tax=Lutimonas zeaxanthinifaciens TaxID=3060215 RepID=UPI00265CC7A8|nr:methyltransferase domain-containing protein [Lutimonas sp. YSD2104]WKK66417.1 methyltransferase domain-containing protein [Lutimonas sp. YSD2104]
MDASEIYDSIYMNGHEVPGYSRYWRYFSNIKSKKDPLEYLARSNEAYWAVKQALAQIVKEKSKVKILEIGSGLGYLTYALKMEGYDIHGMDVSSKAVKKARENFGNLYLDADLFDHAKSHRGQYDVAILTEVIEHVNLPVQFIKAISELINDSGFIIVTTPNRSIAPETVVYDTESPPVHHWWLSENSMEHIGNQLNLTTSFVDFSEFYEKKPTIYNIQRARQRKRAAILDKDGKLLRKSKSGSNSRLKDSLKKIDALWIPVRKLSVSLKSMMSDEKVVCGKRGEFLCAVYQKKK